MLEKHPLKKGDVLILGSNSRCLPLAIEVAMMGRWHGMRTVQNRTGGFSGSLVGPMSSG